MPDSHVFENRVRKLERLLEASRLLNSTLELTELTEIVLRLVQDEVPVDRCTLFVVDRRNNVLRSFLAQGVQKFEIALPMGEGLAGTAAANGEWLDVADAYNDARFHSDFDSRLGYKTNDALCVPVFNREGQVTGILQLLNRKQPFDLAAKEFVMSICTYIGLALQNAWDHRELLESSKIEEELHVVREQLAEAGKRSAMNELVAGIIHEMRNPLSAALGQLALLREEGAAAPKVLDRVSVVEQSIDRALKIAKNFLSFARRPESAPVPIDINALVRQTVDLLAYDSRKLGVHVAVELNTLPPVKLDAAGIRQVFLNILKNALYAAHQSRSQIGIVVISTHQPDTNVIGIKIEDNGPGIPEEVQGRIFEPFFTTKPGESGTGIGLAVSKRILEEHGGSLSFKSTPGTGTVFLMELPVG